jgi:hypothetical protein
MMGEIQLRKRFSRSFAEAAIERDLAVVEAIIGW